MAARRRSFLTPTLDYITTPAMHPKRRTTGLSAGPGATATRGKRILLVDDDPVLRGSLHDVGVAEGFTMISAENGQQALELIRQSRIDLVLLDLTMPVKSGWDTFEELTREHPLIPVIIMTARPNQLFTALNAGAGALMEKPMDIPVLLRTMRMLLTEPHAKRIARVAGFETDFHYKSSARR